MTVPPLCFLNIFGCDGAALKEARMTDRQGLRPQLQVETETHSTQHTAHNTHSSCITYLTQPCGSMDILLDAIEDRAVVFQEDTVSLSTATLQGLGLIHSGSQHLQIQPLGLSISHPHRSAV